MGKGFKEAGFTQFTTRSPGIGFYLPNGLTVRIMKPAGQAPLRASFQNKFNNRIDPFTNKCVQPKREMNRREWDEYQIQATHLELLP